MLVMREYTTLKQSKWAAKLTMGDWSSTVGGTQSLTVRGWSTRELEREKLSAFQTQSVKRGDFVFNKPLLLLKHICPPSIFPASLLGKFQYSQNSVFCGDFPFGSCDWRLLHQKTRSEQCIICQSMRSCNRERWVIITIKLITVKYGLLGWCLLTEVGLTKTEDAAICPVDYRLDNLCHCPRAHLCLRTQTQI